MWLCSPVAGGSNLWLCSPVAGGSNLAEPSQRTPQPFCVYDPTAWLCVWLFLHQRPMLGLVLAVYCWWQKIYRTSWGNSNWLSLFQHIVIMHMWALVLAVYCQIRPEDIGSCGINWESCLWLIVIFRWNVWNRGNLSLLIIGAGLPQLMVFNTGYFNTSVCYFSPTWR